MSAFLSLLVVRVVLSMISSLERRQLRCPEEAIPQPQVISRCRER